MDYGDDFVLIIDFCYNLLKTFTITAFGITVSFWEVLISLIALFIIIYAVFKICE